MNSDVIYRGFEINLRIMRLFHIYPSKKPSFSYKIRSCVVYILCVVTIPSLSILYLLLEENLDMERVNYNGGFLAQTTGFIGKFLPFMIDNRRIEKCIQHFYSSSIKPLAQEEKNFMDECFKVCRRNSRVFLVCSIGAVGSWAIKPFFWKGRNYPVDVWLPFDSTKAVSTYCCVYAFVAMGPILTSICTAALDPFIAGLAYQATCQLKILKKRLQLLDYQKVEASQNTLIYKNIKNCINHHDAVLRFVKEFEICFSWVVASQIAASVVVVCFLCLQLSKIEPSGFYFLQMVAYFSVILAELYFYCYYGQTLSDESDSLTEAIYMGKWYNYDIRSKKALLILMKRSQKPFIVTVGRIIDLSLETFAMILRRSYSLLAFLRNYQ